MNHTVLFPTGFPDVICESQGHQWIAQNFEEADMAELRFRYCQRCERHERLTKTVWEVNDIRPKNCE